MILDFPQDVCPFILDSLSLSDVINYSQIDTTCKNCVGNPFDIASVYGLRDSNPAINLSSLNFLSDDPNPLLTERIMSFLERCYDTTETTPKSDCECRELAIKNLHRLKPAKSDHLLTMLKLDKENHIEPMEQLAELIGYIGLSDEDVYTIVEMLSGDKFQCQAIQIVLNLIKHDNVLCKHAAQIMEGVDILMHHACSTVKDKGGDDQYMIGDCVECLVRIGYRHDIDPIESLMHLNIWTTFVVDSDAVEDIRECFFRLGDCKTPDVTEFLVSILADL